MKKTAIVTALILLSASTASASPWKYLGSDGKSNHYFYKPKTMSVSKDAIVSGWTKKEYNVDNTALTAKVQDDFIGTKTVAAFEQFNCIKKLKRTTLGQTYEVGKEPVDLSKTDWLPIEPGSMDEGLFNALCKDAQKGL